MRNFKLPNDEEITLEIFDWKSPFGKKLGLIEKSTQRPFMTIFLHGPDSELSTDESKDGTEIIISGNNNNIYIPKSVLVKISDLDKEVRRIRSQHEALHTDPDENGFSLKLFADSKPRHEKAERVKVSMTRLYSSSVPTMDYPLSMCFIEGFSEEDEIIMQKDLPVFLFMSIAEISFNGVDYGEECECFAKKIVKHIEKLTKQ